MWDYCHIEQQAANVGGPGTKRADARVARGLNANTHWSDMVKYYSYGCVRELEKNDDILLSKGTNSDF